MRRALAAACLTFVLASAVHAQDEAKVEEAIRKGIAWIKSKGTNFGDPAVRTCTRELVLLTLLHGGVHESDPFFAPEFAKMLEEQPRYTYRTALRAMVLEEVERVKYQHLIWHCAEFLVDNQAKNGQWSYGDPVLVTDIPPANAVATGRKKSKSGLRRFGPRRGPRVKPKVVRIVEVKQRKTGKAGDNSNTQYAALGLRACFDSGIRIPKDVIDRSLDWWRKCQEKGAKSAAVASGGIAASPRGWDYKNGDKPYGSMTAGAVGAMAIFLHMQGKAWNRDGDLNSGVSWLGANFAVDTNPIRGSAHHYYYLYGLERAGVLYDTPKFGTHDWYAEGAKYLLKHQKESGEWKGLKDTCFAILFLKRATRPLIESVENR